MTSLNVHEEKAPRNTRALRATVYPQPHEWPSMTLRSQCMYFMRRCAGVGVSLYNQDEPVGKHVDEEFEGEDDHERRIQTLRSRARTMPLSSS